MKYRAASSEITRLDGVRALERTTLYCAVLRCAAIHKLHPTYFWTVRGVLPLARHPLLLPSPSQSESHLHSLSPSNSLSLSSSHSLSLSRSHIHSLSQTQSPFVSPSLSHSINSVVPTCTCSPCLSVRTTQTVRSSVCH